MNLAILIGVSEYSQPVSNLPACKNDLALMSSLIKATTKFSEVLEIGTDTKSTTAKSEIAQFLGKHSGQSIDELFFYYTGHGELFANDFYFLFTDFSENQRNKTALSNAELDAMIRPLSPKLTIKVVDACHAGVAYVKESDALEKRLSQSKATFQNCYFMFSSQSAQSSYQDSEVSAFTEAYIASCSTFNGASIRYKDIVDHIADVFSSNSDQTPTFVIQASCVEVFCHLDASIRQLQARRNPPGGKLTSAGINPLGSPFVEAIKTSASEYCTKDEVMNFFDGFIKTIQQSTRFSGELSEFYLLETTTSSSYANIPGMRSIGIWLKENPGEYFAKLETTREAYQVYVDMFGNETSRSMLGTSPQERWHQVPSGITCTMDCPFKAVTITAKPAVENLPYATSIIVFIFSKRECVFFFCNQTVKEIDWGVLSPLVAAPWKYRRVAIKNDPQGADSGASMLSAFESFLTQATKEKLGIAQDTAGEEQADAQKDDTTTSK